MSFSTKPAVSQHPKNWSLSAIWQIRTSLWFNVFRNLLLGLCFSFAGSTAFANQSETVRGWVEDPTGNMTLAEAQQATQTPSDVNLFTQGFSQSTFWLRLRIDPDQYLTRGADDRLIIRIRPPIQDQIQIFDPLAANDKARLTGDFYDWQNDEYLSLNLNFVVPLGETPRDIWLRLRTRQSTLTLIEIMTPSEARAADQRQSLMFTLYFVVLATCMGLAIHSYVVQRDRLTRLYVGRELLTILYACGVLGFFRVIGSGILPTAWIDPVTNNVIFIFIAYLIWFDSQLLKSFKPHPWLLKALLLLTLALPISWGLQLIGATHLALKINAYIVFLECLLALLTAVSTSNWHTGNSLAGHKPLLFTKNFLIAFYALNAFIVLEHRLSFMGIIGIQLSNPLYLNLVYTLVSSAMMVTFLLSRAHHMAIEHQEILHKAQVSEAEAAQERALGVERSNFLHMLAHEMKTPLAIVRMALDKAALPSNTLSMANHAVSDMNGIIERLMAVQRLEDRKVNIIRGRLNLFELLDDVIGSFIEKGRIVLADTNVTLHTDQHLLRTIFSNLLDNAIKYGAEGSKVLVNVAAKDNWVRIEVINEIGPAGTPEPTQVFQKYYRSKQAEAYTGSGLGLYLVKALAAILGGDIEYQRTDSTVLFVVELSTE